MTVERYTKLEGSDEYTEAGDFWSFNVAEKNGYVTIDLEASGDTLTRLLEIVRDAVSELEGSI